MTTEDTLNTAAGGDIPVPHMDQLRQHMLATLASLRDRANPMEPDRARAIATVANVLVDSARVEVDYIKATGTNGSKFIGQPSDVAPPSGITSVRRHLLKG